MSIRSSFSTFEQLDLPRAVVQATRAESGLIIVCGAPESGRATTIASLVNYLNTTSPTRRHCVLFEQPIEYLHRSQQWSMTQREVGSDTDTFEDCVRSAILQDADAIVIGAIEEPPVVEAAMRAVEALAEALHAIVGQKLIPRQSGGRRILATQLLFDMPYIRESILDAGSSEHLNDALMKGRDQYETQTFDQSLADLVLSGHVAFAMAVKLASNSLDLELQLRGSR